MTFIPVGFLSNFPSEASVGRGKVHQFSLSSLSSPHIEAGASSPALTEGGSGEEQRGGERGFWLFHTKLSILSNQSALVVISV